MPIWLDAILEIIKLTIPGLIVLLAVYYMLKQHFDNQIKMKSVEVRQGIMGTTLPVRLQAYERLMLFCERISIPNLVFRLRRSSMTSRDLQTAMMVAVQKEFEHNVTQQLYVSEPLWKIIKLAKEETLHIITEVSTGIDPEADSETLTNALLDYSGKQEKSAIDQAILAVKKEIAVLL